MKHNKIFSSEVVHKGKTLDRILESDKKDSNDNVISVELSNDFRIDSTKDRAKILTAMYNDSLDKISFISENSDPFGTNRRNNVISVLQYEFHDLSNYQAPYTVCGLYVCVLQIGASTITKCNIIRDSSDSVDSTTLLYSGVMWNSNWAEAFELAGLTIEDFYRKFLPDNPYFPAE